MSNPGTGQWTEARFVLPQACFAGRSNGADFRLDGVEQRTVGGRDQWQEGRVAWVALPQQPAAACGAWIGDDTFTAKLCFYETQ
jgi:hypothetical protein